MIQSAFYKRKIELKAMVFLKYWTWLDQQYVDLKLTFINFFNLCLFCSIHCESDFGFQI